MAARGTYYPVPSVYRCDGRDPALRARVIRSPAARSELPGTVAPPWLVTGPWDQPFDFCARISLLCADIARKCPDLSHVDVNQLLISLTQARGTRRRGLQARLTPLRFANGQLTTVRQKVTFQIQRFCDAHRDYLYLISFCLPRFLDQDFDEKFITLFHELYHIAPEFNGDLRRHGGRYFLHTQSQRAYDRHMAELARSYLATKPEPILFDFMRLNFAQLHARHGSVVGLVVPRPRIYPVASLQESDGNCHDDPTI